MVLDTTGEIVTKAQDERKVLSLTASKMLDVLPRMFKQMMTEGKLLMPDDIAAVGDAQFRVIHMLGQQDCTISELARRMKVTAPTVSRMIDSMVGRGLVDRRPDTNDRRIIWLSLSTEGQAAFRKVERVFRAGVASMMGPLSDDQLRTVLAAMEILESLIHKDPQDKSNY